MVTMHTDHHGLKAMANYIQEVSLPMVKLVPCVLPPPTCGHWNTVRLM
jgi:hypothetical protein